MAIIVNNFSKEERVAFELLLEGFQDALIMTKAASIFKTDQVTMQRAGDIMWRPQPYISKSYDGYDMTDKFKGAVQLSVPASIDMSKSVPWAMTAKDLRDSLQEQRLGSSAKQKLASDINVALLEAASDWGSLVITRPAAAAGFDDVSQCDIIMNEQGVPFEDRYIALSSRDYNNMAIHLQAFTFDNKKSLNAYENAYIGRIASFNALKLDYALILPKNGVAVTTKIDISKNIFNIENISSPKQDPRKQDIVISDGSNIKVGDCFHIENLYAVNHITKEKNGQLKTFRVVAVADNSNITITPPIILNQDSICTDYTNCYIESSILKIPQKINFTNVKEANINPFWQKDALEIIPGRYAIPGDAGTSVLRASTDQGIELVMQKWYDINTMEIKFRVDTLFGVLNKQPEMSGIMLFSQS